MALGWLAFGGLGLFASVGRSTFGLVSGVGIVTLGAIQLVAGVKLRRTENT